MDSVRITEVAPRDGLQNEPGLIPTRDKVRLIELCSATGVDEVEITSFVSPRWVPQLGDASEVVRALGPNFRPAHGPGAPMYSVLVPNEKGLDAALAAAHDARARIAKVSVFTAASETFSRKNTNASIAETLDRFAPVIAKARSHNLLVRGYVSCAIACPFEGPIAPALAVDVALRLRDLGVSEIDLADTIGVATPETTGSLLRAARAALGESWWTRDRLTLHLHDTFAHAAACVRTALDLGVRSFDASVAGLGGCPYASTPAKRAPGNISTDTLVRTIRGAGLTTSVDDAPLAEAAAYAREIIARARDGVAHATDAGRNA